MSRKQLSTTYFVRIDIIRKLLNTHVTQQSTIFRSNLEGMSPGHLITDTHPQTPLMLINYQIPAMNRSIGQVANF
jgi:hypothetical protein